MIYGMTAGDIEQTILNYLSVRVEEKDKFGEVFTPMSLINEMFDKMPESIWSDPDNKWLDPANGIGNFPMVAYMRLMEGLKTHPDYSNDQKRNKHIIENMLYMVEINPKNVKISRQIFGSNANICCADFLNETDKVMRDFGVDKFDIIIGNPPFNASQENEGKKGGGDSLWPKFVELSLDLLPTNGYLVFVHPSSWRKPQSESSKTIGLFNKMAHENHIEYLEIHDTKDGMSTFHAGTRYDWYVIKKHKNTSKTVIKDQQANTTEINLSEWNFLPNYNFSEIKKILSDTEQDYVIFTRNQFGSDKPWTSDTEKGEFKFPLIHSTPIDGPRKYWSSTKTPPVTNAIPMFGVPKVIFGESGINSVIVDTSGKYGLTQGAIGLKIKSEKEGKLFAHALESSDFKDILNAMSFGNFRIDWRMFKYFRPDFYKKFLGAQSGIKIKQCIILDRPMTENVPNPPSDESYEGVHYTPFGVNNPDMNELYQKHKEYIEKKVAELAWKSKEQTYHCSDCNKRLASSAPVVLRRHFCSYKHLINSFLMETSDKPVKERKPYTRKTQSVIPVEPSATLKESFLESIEEGYVFN